MATAVVTLVMVLLDKPDGGERDIALLAVPCRLWSRLRLAPTRGMVRGPRRVLGFCGGPERAPAGCVGTQHAARGV